MINKLNTAIHNRLKYGELIVAELQPTSSQRRRWLAIYQPKMKPLGDNIPDHVFSILDFELDVQKIDEYFSGDDMINERRYYANTEKELFDILDTLNIDLGLFTYPWKCDYPL